MLNFFYPNNDYYNGGYLSPQAMKRAQVERLYQKEQQRREQALREERHRQARLREEERRRSQERASDEQEYKLVRGADGYLYRVPVHQRPQYPRQRPNRPTSRPIVRGSDGRLYRVFDDDDRMSENSYSNRNEDMLEEPRFQIVRGPDGRLYKVPIRDEDYESDEHEAMDEEEPEVAQPSPRDAADKHIERKTSGPAKKRPSRRKKVTVIVEDASDSENEDEYKSYWRNRHPSPGVLMEPVQDIEL